MSVAIAAIAFLVGAVAGYCGRAWYVRPPTKLVLRAVPCMPCGGRGEMRVRFADWSAP